LSFICGIYACVSLILDDVLPAIFCGVAFFATLVILIVCLFKKDFLSGLALSLGTKKIMPVCLIVVAGILLGAGLSLGSYFVNVQRQLSNGNYTISAKVGEISTEESSSTILLKNVVIDGKSYNFKMRAIIDTEYLDIGVGDTISCDAYLYATSLVSDGKIDTKFLKNKLYYYCSITSSEISVTDGNADFIDGIKDKTKTILLENMSEQNAGFSYATLVGDKSMLSDEYYQIFKNAGLAHILAVSGLHVGFLVLAIKFLLNKLKIKRKNQFFVIAVVLLFYCTLCGFSPSIFRASVMSLCLMLGMVLGERNDAVSNLSLAGVIVLLTQPLYLFDVGFLLSFGSVFGILFLQKPIANLLAKARLPKSLCEMIAVTISATLGTIPATFSYFGEISVIFALSNLVVLPLFSVMFVILLICAFINLILPLAFLIKFAEFFVNIVVNLSAVFAKVGMVETFDFSAFLAVLYYVVMFVCSPYFMVKAKSKLIVCFAILMFLSPCLAIYNAPKYYETYSVSTVGGVSNTLFVTTNQNQKLLLNVGTDEYELQSVENMLKKLKVKKLDYLVLAGYKDSYQSLVCDIAGDFEIAHIVVMGTLDSSTKLGLAQSIKTNKDLEFCEETEFCTQNEQITINILEISGVLKATSIEYGNNKVAKLESSLTKLQIQNNLVFFENCDVCFSKYYSEKFEDLSFQKFVCHSSKLLTQKTIYVETDVLWTF
jgi:ComEC/Rec2-related protein